MRPHDGKSPTGMRERQPAKPANWTYNGLVDHGQVVEQAPIKVAPGAAARLSVLSCKARRSSRVPNTATAAACNIKANCHNRQAETGGSG